jgi:hypothetical protein
MKNIKRPSPFRLPLIALAGALMTLSATAPAQHRAPPDPLERPFLTENDQAMSRMMSGMAAKPNGNIDDDFVAMMQPHHQGAIDMAKAELRYGHNEQLRRIAQEIIVDQQQEIVAMSVALKRPIPPSAPVPTQTPPIVSHQASPHSMDMPMPMPMPADGR